MRAADDRADGPGSGKGGFSVTEETGGNPPGKDGSEDAGHAPRIDHRKILDKGKSLLGSTAWLSSLALIIVAICLTFLVYNDKVCGIDKLGRDGIDKIRFRSVDSPCEVGRGGGEANVVSSGGGAAGAVQIAGVGGGVVQTSALDLTKAYEEIVAQVRADNGLAADALLPADAREQIENRTRENDLLYDLLEMAKKRSGLFKNQGSARKATVPADPQPAGCDVYVKRKDAGKWLAIEGPNGHQIVRYANDSLPDEIDGRAVVTEIQVSGRDAVRLNIDLTGIEDNYTVVHAKEASEAERNSRRC
jgi:hypothetical protein